MKFIYKILFLLLYVSIAHPCQYNVRETGFADFGDTHYNLYMLVVQKTDAIKLAQYKSVANEMLAESNINFDIIAVHEQKEHPVLQLLTTHNITSFPALVLLSVDGQSLVLPFPSSIDTQMADFRSILKKVLSSPFRTKIKQKAIDNFAVILLMEGKNSQQNLIARQQARDAIEHVRSKMDMLPKPIKNPPSLVILDSNSAQTEKILLWSLGLNRTQLEEPIAAVMYGRMRWFGPLFHNENIIKERLAELILVVGADCECGLDKQWLQGTMLPTKWDSAVQNRVVKNLGFDPENPLVKIEMNRIMRAGSSFPGVPITGIKPEQESKKSSHELNKLDEQESLSSHSENANVFETRDNAFTFSLPVIIVVTFFSIILFTGLFIFLRSNKKKK